MPYEYAKLKGRITEKFGTQEKFADAVGISPNSLSLKLNGKTGISQHDIISWSQLLDISPDEYGDFYFA